MEVLCGVTFGLLYGYCCVGVLTPIAAPVTKCEITVVTGYCSNTLPAMLSSHDPSDG